jgi:hypothetical protein
MIAFSVARCQVRELEVSNHAALTKKSADASYEKYYPSN